MIGCNGGWGKRILIILCLSLSFYHHVSWLFFYERKIKIVPIETIKIDDVDPAHRTSAGAPLKEVEEDGTGLPLVRQPKVSSTSTSNPSSTAQSPASMILDSVVAQLSTHNNTRNSTTVTGVTKLYSKLRLDRSGSALTDMMTTHAYAYSRGLNYVGACGESRYKDSVEELFFMLGWNKEWQLLSACPNTADGDVVIGDSYGWHFKDGRYYTPTWVNVIRSLTTAYDVQTDGADSFSFKIAVHVRRGDVRPCMKVVFKNQRRYLPNAHYLRLIDEYYKDGAEVHIFSESNSYENFTDFTSRGYTLRLDEPLVDTWRYMINSDVLIMSRSSFSYLPAVMSKGIVVYTPYWQAPLTTWDVVDKDMIKQTKRENKAINYKVHCKAPWLV